MSHEQKPIKTTWSPLLGHSHKGRPSKSNINHPQSSIILVQYLVIMTANYKDYKTRVVRRDEKIISGGGGGRGGVHDALQLSSHGAHG